MLSFSQLNDLPYLAHFCVTEEIQGIRETLITNKAIDINVVLKFAVLALYMDTLLIIESILGRRA